MKKIYYILIPLLLIIIAGCIYYIFYYKKSAPKVTQEKQYTFKDDKFNLSFSYPESFQKIKLTEEDTKNKYIFRAEEIFPSSLIGLRYEERVGILKLAQKGSIMEILKRNFDEQYPNRFPDFKQINGSDIKIDGSDSADYTFTYTGTDQKTLMKQRFLIFTHDYDQKELGTVAFYFSFQSKESDFEEMDKKFQNIIDSIGFTK